MKKLFFCAVWLCLAIAGGADLSAQKMVSVHKISGVVLDSLTREPLAGAFVSVINRTGSHHKAVGEDGRFNISLVKDGEQLILEATYIGYRITRKVFDADKEKIDAGEILMSPDPEELDAVIVKGRRQLFKEKGDTVIYYPSSLYLREGATALDALAKMPGVEAGVEGVTVQGKNVERTYVNGKLIFGKDSPLNALENIEAKDVATILAYDEYDEVAYKTQGKHGRKRKVLNVVTFDFFNQSIAANLIAGGGVDLQKDMDGKYQGRYLGGAGFKFFSERRQLILDYVANNSLYHNNAVYTTNRTTGTGSSTRPYEETDKAVVHYADKIKKTWDISGTYKYNGEFSRTKTVDHTDYFAGADFPSRMYADTVSGYYFGRRHSAGLAVENFTDKTYTTINAEAAFILDKTSRDNFTSIVTEGHPVSTTSVSSYDKLKRKRFNAEGSFTLFSKKGTFKINAAADLGYKDEDADRDERYTETLYDKTLILDGKGELRDIRGGLSYSLPSREFGSFSFGYDARYKYDKTRRIAVDRFETVDSTMSRDYTDDYIGNAFKVNYRFRKKGWSLSANVEYNNNLFNLKDAFYDVPNRRKSFNAVLPHITVGYDKGSNIISFDYSTNVTPPSMEHLSDRLDNRNPMFLSAGNPGLKQGYDHVFMLQLQSNDMERQSYFYTNATYSLKNNIIGEKTRYLAAGEYLPAYRYTASEGAVLTSYENLQGAMDFNFNAGYTFWLPAIQCFPGISVLYTFDKLPMYVNGNLVNRLQHTPQLILSVESNFSKDIEVELEYDILYSHNSAGAGQTYSSLVNSVKFSFYAQFLKRMYATVDYRFYDDYSYTFRSSSVSDHKLDVGIGCKLFKNRRGDIRLTVYDALNRSRDFEQTVYADRVHRTWSYKTPRFVFLTFTYKFLHNK